MSRLYGNKALLAWRRPSIQWCQLQRILVADPELTHLHWGFSHRWLLVNKGIDWVLSPWKSLKTFESLPEYVLLLICEYDLYWGHLCMHMHGLSLWPTFSNYDEIVNMCLLILEEHFVSLKGKAWLLQTKNDTESFMLLLLLIIGLLIDRYSKRQSNI